MKTTSLILLLFLWLELNKSPAIIIMKDVPIDIEFSKENLKAYIKEIGLLYPKVVLAQARIETGNFTSTIFKENNNLFGMKFPRQRETTAIDINRNHSVYENWKKSVDDYKLWQCNMIHRISSKEEYLSYLGRNYAKDKKYVSRLRQIIWKLDSQEE